MLHTKKVFAIVLILLLLLTSYVLMFVNTQQSKKESIWISHSHEVGSAIGNLRTQRKSAILYTYQAITQTDDKASIKMIGAADSAEVLLKELSSLVADNHGMAKIVERNLTHHLLNDLKVARKVLEQVSLPTNSLEQKFSFLKELDTTIEINAVPQILDLIESKEESLLRLRQATLKGVTNNIDTVVMISLLSALVFTIVMASIFNREIKERKKITIQSASYKSILETQVNELEKANGEITTLKNLEKFSSTGRMARTIAHEIRNPLTNINLANEQIKDLIPDNDEAEMLCNMIDRNSNRINELISGLLNATKFMEINSEDIDINEVVDDALELAEDRISLLNIKIVKNYKKDFRGIKGDAAKLKIAMLNIIVNAIEAMPAENGVLKIYTYEDNKGKCCINISDNGKGMDEEVLQRLFDPFFTTKEKGNGLGMTNTQNVIITHKGELKVKSKPGEGTEFEIIL